MESPNKNIEVAAKVYQFEVIFCLKKAVFILFWPFFYSYIIRTRVFHDYASNEV